MEHPPTVSSNIRAKARQRAEDFLLDQAYFPVSKTVFAQFQTLLERPLPPTDRLRRLLKTTAPWER
ncbi:MAG: DUF1778 domain-containing protein [Bryobacteraceae bacterium]|nr:DUF1778 domain-containing protein [Bryobacteraceae bacterium]